ncbi:hypothetical protein GCM10027515_30090 [Schumannella luteola]|uniref:Uncharacterized protein n=1 Tax=Schumannella luteola TaxID=472059 RepID=A0A852YD13_9MICO|nr:hypothetical protein [Schumannella luteola]NYG99190.1 hypothetical protein [Schumannella luteola]TPW90537.1 hypothetical protein FJ656_36925 [Schumannella luteola]
MTESAEFSREDEIALGHAWDWFNQHAGQRMQSINMMLVSITFSLAGYGLAFQARNFIVAVAICVEQL